MQGITGWEVQHLLKLMHFLKGSSGIYTGMFGVIMTKLVGAS